MGKIETCKRDCRRSVGIKYKNKTIEKNGFILRWWRKICVVKGGEAMQVATPT